MPIESTIYTAKEAASKLDLTDGRIRQICRWKNIGKKHGRDWFLTDSDLSVIQRFFSRKSRKQD